MIHFGDIMQQDCNNLIAFILYLLLINESSRSYGSAMNNWFDGEWFVHMPYSKMLYTNNDNKWSNSSLIVFFSNKYVVYAVSIVI